jgi:hypothetical protein
LDASVFAFPVPKQHLPYVPVVAAGKKGEDRTVFLGLTEAWWVQ